MYVNKIQNTEVYTVCTRVNRTCNKSSFFLVPFVAPRRCPFPTPFPTLFLATFLALFLLAITLDLWHPRDDSL